MSDPSRFLGLPVAEFGAPGPVRDSLIMAIADGAKTTTSSLLSEYEYGQDPLPWTGARWAVIDSQDQPVFIIEITGVEIRALSEVDMGHVAGEAEGYRSPEEWRQARRQAWKGQSIDADTPVVLESFRLVAE